MSLIPDGPRLTPPDDGVPDDPDLLAAEYVLGSLDPDQRHALEVAARSDLSIGQAIATWEARLAPLAETVPAASPPPELWQRLVLAAGLGVPVVARPVARSSRPARSKASAGPWKAATAASLMLAAGLGAYAFGPQQSTADPMFAALSPAGSPGATFLVRVDSDGLATVFALNQATASVPGRSLQLWAVADATAAPVSVGLLNPVGTARLRVRSAPGTRLLVSLEPPGGSQTGKPTGPVVYAGLLSNGT